MSTYKRDDKAFKAKLAARVDAKHASFASLIKVASVADTPASKSPTPWLKIAFVIFGLVLIFITVTPASQHKFTKHELYCNSLVAERQWLTSPDAKDQPTTWLAQVNARYAATCGDYNPDQEGLVRP